MERCALNEADETALEVDRLRVKSTYKYIDQNASDRMDIILAKTIAGLSDYVSETRPDLIIVHGDRVEAMAGAIVGSLNSILAGHIEGGEVSGTIDEIIRYAISNMMNSKDLPSVESAKQKYDIAFETYSLFMYHPVTTALEELAYGFWWKNPVIIGTSGWSEKI